MPGLACRICAFPKQRDVHGMARVALRIVKNRLHPRTSVFFCSSVTGVNCEAGGIIRNLSAGGACLSTGDDALCPGEPVSISLRHVGEVRGYITWARGGRFGVRFDQSIDPLMVLQQAA